MEHSLNGQAWIALRNSMPRCSGDLSPIPDLPIRPMVQLLSMVMRAADNRIATLDWLSQPCDSFRGLVASFSALGKRAPCLLPWSVLIHKLKEFGITNFCHFYRL